VKPALFRDRKEVFAPLSCTLLSAGMELAVGREAQAPLKREEAALPRVPQIRGEKEIEGVRRRRKKRQDEVKLMW
jgi:hypothetical protein